MFRSIRIVAALLAATAVIGCDSSSEPPDNAAFVGTYALVSINGAAVPVVLPTPDGLVEVVSGQLIFNLDSGCTGAIVIREPGGTETQTMSDTCTWTRTGSQISLTWSDGGTDTATLQGSSITLVASDLGNLTLVFQK